MKKKLTVKEILNCKGKKKLTEVYVHNTIEAEACEKAGIDMIISSENNNFKFLRESAQNIFFTVGLQYGRYLSEYEIVKRSFELLEMGADGIYCPQSSRFIKAIADEGIPVVGHTGFIPYKKTHYGGFKAFGKNTKEAAKILKELHILEDSGAFAAEIEIVPEEVVEVISKKTDLFLIGGWEAEQFVMLNIYFLRISLDIIMATYQDMQKLILIWKKTTMKLRINQLMPIIFL